MPLKRPKAEPNPSSTSSDAVLRPSAKRRKSDVDPGTLHSRKVYILDAKLKPDEVAELVSLVDKAGAILVSEAKESEIVITAVGMRKRLERHIDWSVAKSKALVTPNWLRDSVQQGHALPCGTYAALASLHDTTAANCPTESDSDQDESSAQLSPPTSTPSEAKSSPSRANKEVEPAHIPENLLPPRVPLKTTPDLDHTVRFSCQRTSSLVCPNQELCEQLDVVRKLRELEGEERSSLSYRRAVASIKSYPRQLSKCDREEIARLPNIGTKISKMVLEYLENGNINEVEKIKASERYNALVLFASIYGIGPSTARNLYARGLRNLRDLEAFYEVNGPPVEGIEGPQSVEMDIQIALGLRAELAIKIPREEVELIHRTIMNELEVVQPGCVSMIVGGYRRGKSESNDVDIVFTHPDASKAIGLCTKLVRRLHEQGMVTHVMHLSSFHAHNALRTTHWDSLEKSLTVFRPPIPNPTRRRVDLIFALPETYWTAVVGWTGSTMFERDLRSVAKLQGMKFDSSGITRRHDSTLFYPRTEKEVFDMFGLPWIDPTLRNADA
ncbi:Nucleotidyltransferase [Auriscalpium vulgare]|uniref:Nucleotidyltransferase n=1 Tax=Auriscalpium vulgare TaxID=40419 RepID=A0ACB8S3R4_9AGAM|nr:Nucleotidyltransferase [Auriscalpium vulgare]